MLRWLRRPADEWGASHTRYIAPDGTLHRAFVRYFTPAALRREARRAGLRVGAWHGAHLELLAPDG